MSSDALLPRLRRLVGRRFDYRDACWQLIEVLSEEQSLVLHRLDGGAGRIQTDQFGQGARRTPETLTLRISDADDGYSDEVMALLAGKRA